MADNRMYLYHRGSNHAVYIAKRLGGASDSQYRDSNDELQNNLQKLFDLAFEWEIREGDYNLDCFEVIYETDDWPENLVIIG